MIRQQANSGSPSRIGALFLWVIVAITLSGCTSLRRIIAFKDQASQARATFRIEGRIATEGPLQGNLVVILGRLVDWSTARRRPSASTATFA